MTIALQVSSLALLLLFGVLYARGILFVIRRIRYVDLPNPQFSEAPIARFLVRDFTVDVVATLWFMAPIVVRLVGSIRWTKVWRLQLPPRANETLRYCLSWRQANAKPQS
jgi:hypothetical protein